MYIEKRIKLNNNNYFIKMSVKYTKKDELVLTDSENKEFDGGTITELIQKIEKNYTKEKVKQYNSRINFMSDVLYIYDRIPIISGIRDVYFDKNNLPYSFGYISKEEIINYIDEHNVIMKSHDKFDISDSRTWDA